MVHLVGGRKSERKEKNLVSLFVFGWRWKSGGMKKYFVWLRRKMRK